MNLGGWGLHIMKVPSGRFAFVGSVPACLIEGAPRNFETEQAAEDYFNLFKYQIIMQDLSPWEKYFINRLAAELYIEGLTPENFTLSKALDIMGVMPIKTTILTRNLDVILYKIAEFTEAESN